MYDGLRVRFIGLLVYRFIGLSGYGCIYGVSFQTLTIGVYQYCHVFVTCIVLETNRASPKVKKKKRQRRAKNLRKIKQKTNTKIRTFRIIENFMESTCHFYDKVVRWCSDTLLLWYYNTLILCTFILSAQYHARILWYSDTMPLWYYDPVRLWYDETMRLWEECEKSMRVKHCNTVILLYYHSMIVWYYCAILWYYVTMRYYGTTILIL